MWIRNAASGGDAGTAVRAALGANTPWPSISGSTPRWAPEAFSIRPRKNSIRHHWRRCARDDLRRARAARTTDEWRAARRASPQTHTTSCARLPRHQVQHALGHLPAELGARPALRHGARPEILGSLPRHDGREPLQRALAVDHASVHLHDPAEEFPGSQQVDGRRVRRMAAPVPRDLPHGEGTRARHLHRVLEHLRQRGILEGARRREAEFLSALLRATATPPTVTKRYLRESVTQVLEEYPDLDGIGVSHGEGMARHDAARAPAVRRRGVRRGRTRARSARSR